MNDGRFDDIVAKIESAVSAFSRVLMLAHDGYNNAEIIYRYILAFADFGIWCAATERLEENQIIFTDDLTSDLARDICDAADANEVVKQHYFGNNEQKMNALINRCKTSRILGKYQSLYIQTVAAYNMGHYHLSCVGLFAIADGILSDVSQMVTSTNFKARISAIKDKIGAKVKLSDIDKKTLRIYSSLKTTDRSIFENSHFSEQEPEGVNRHWVVHGRTRKDFTQYDFLKILLWIDAIGLLDDILDSKERSVEHELL